MALIVLTIDILIAVETFPLIVPASKITSTLLQTYIIRNKLAREEFAWHTTIEFQRYNTIYLKTVDGNITKFRAFRNFPTSFVDITFSRPGDYLPFDATGYSDMRTFREMNLERKPLASYTRGG
ncbi:hypothetical protein V1477_010849 [Vespula maculifrons]|uniref:Uncharacterized protein n=1 Tax=Vespula maculifrons TaxID=7453 RepID=A0ABD2C371_VESMC